MGDISEHYSRHEFACQCGCGLDTVDVELVRVLESVSSQFGQPVWVASGCRCPEHNVKVGGSAGSQHMYGKAADICVQGIPPDIVGAWLEAEYLDEYGIGYYDGWVHIDVRSVKARWDDRRYYNA